MKTKEIIKELGEIERIAKFQQKRLMDKKAIHKDLILRQALDFIGVHILNILKIEEPEIKGNTLRNELIDLIKSNEENGGIMMEEIKEKIKNPDLDKEIIRLLEDGFIFEPRPHKLRWLG